MTWKAVVRYALLVGIGYLLGGFVLAPLREPDAPVVDSVDLVCE